MVEEVETGAAMFRANLSIGECLNDVLWCAGPLEGVAFQCFRSYLIYESHLFCLLYRRGCMLSAQYGVHAPCWRKLMVSQLDDFRGDDKD